MENLLKVRLYAIHSEGRLRLYCDLLEGSGEATATGLPSSLAGKDTIKRALRKSGVERAALAKLPAETWMSRDDLHTLGFAIGAGTKSLFFA